MQCFQSQKGSGQVVKNGALGLSLCTAKCIPDVYPRALCKALSAISECLHFGEACSSVKWLKFSFLI